MAVVITFLIILTLVSPVTGAPFYYLAYLSKNNVQRIFGCLLLAFLMASFGYCFQNPKTDPDLVRYLEMVRGYADLKFLQIFNAGMYKDLYVIDIWFWLVAKTGDYQLVTSISCFLNYLIWLYIFQDFCKQNNISTLSQGMFTIALFGLINFSVVVNSVRGLLAFTLIMLAIYRELYQKKKNILTYFLYVVPLGMHFAAVLILIMRLLLCLKEKFIKILVALIIGIPFYIEYLVYAINYISRGIPFSEKIQYFTLRCLMYLKWDTGGWASIVSSSGFYKLNKIFSICALVLSAYAFYISKKHNRVIWSTAMDNFLLIYYAFTVTCFFMTTPIYQRFTVPLWTFCVSVSLKATASEGNMFTKFIYVYCLCGVVFVGYFLNGYMLNTMIPIGNYMTRVLTFTWLCR